MITAGIENLSGQWVGWLGTYGSVALSACGTGLWRAEGPGILQPLSGHDLPFWAITGGPHSPVMMTRSSSCFLLSTYYVSGMVLDARHTVGEKTAPAPQT